jgi:hypothetical protein
MVAGHEDEINLGDGPNPFGAYSLNPAQSGSLGEPFVFLAMDFAGQTADAFCTVMKEIEFAHRLLLIT